MRKVSIVFTTTYMIMIYTFLVLFKDQESIRHILGTMIFPLIGAGVSFVWIFQAFRTLTGKHKYVWLLFALGNLSFIIAQSIWYVQIKINMIPMPYPSLADYLWLTQYLLYLAALIIEISIIKGVPLVRFISNISIFMVTAATLSIHFLIAPILKASSDSILKVAFSLAYPIIDLSLLFVIISLYYLAKYSINKKILSFLTLGFFIQIIADSAHTYLLSKGNYAPGGMVDPLWILTPLMIGIAAVFAKNRSIQAVENISILKHEYNIFPYVGAFILLILVILNQGVQSVKWPGIGLFLVMFLIMIRQINMLVVNRNLLKKITINHEKLEHMAFFDELTDLPNRAMFHKNLAEKMKEAKEQNNHIAIMFIDLDRFKMINDAMGHSIGDLFLKNVAKRMVQLLGHQGAIYRFGGDEFCALIEKADQRKAIMIALKLISGFVKPFDLENREYYTTPSIGISFYPNDGEDGDSLIKHADMAMYKAKGLGGNNYQLYTNALISECRNKMEMENALRKALINQEFVLHYQPKVNLHRGELVGLEALIRWKHPKWEYVSPLQFISIAEETGLIIPIGAWVLKEAVQQLKKWHNEGFSTLSMAVNISPRQLQDQDFIKMVKKVLKDNQLDPQYLLIEITESMMNNIQESISILTELKQIGVKISIDDFGTGYSSLSYLKYLPIDEIKIDKSFVDDIPKNRRDVAIVKTIIDLSHHLQVNITGEGIETEQQYRTLSEHHCHVGQGYFFSKPLPAADVEHLFGKSFLIKWIHEI
jgi:diguanylate cyclase (GGDEF)-like protein